MRSGLSFEFCQIRSIVDQILIRSSQNVFKVDQYLMRCSRSGIVEDVINIVSGMITLFMNQFPIFIQLKTKFVSLDVIDLMNNSYPSSNFIDSFEDNIIN